MRVNSLAMQVERLVPRDALPHVAAAQGVVARTARLPVLALHGVTQAVGAAYELTQAVALDAAALLGKVGGVGVAVVGLLAHHQAVDHVGLVDAAAVGRSSSSRPCATRRRRGPGRRAARRWPSRAHGPKARSRAWPLPGPPIQPRSCDGSDGGTPEAVVLLLCVGAVGAMGLLFLLLPLVRSCCDPVPTIGKGVRRRISDGRWRWLICYLRACKRLFMQVDCGVERGVQIVGS